MHTPFIRLCLMTKCYRDGAAVLDIDLVEFPYVKSKPGEPENTPGGRKEVTYQDVLCYFLYGGMIYMGLKEWRRAADFLTYVSWFLEIVQQTSRLTLKLDCGFSWKCMLGNAS